MSQQKNPSGSERLRERLRSARNVFVLTGAGMSAESGVPTFRGGGGAAVWKGMPFDVISSASMIERDLKAVWEWFDYRRNLLKKVEPNAAHHALAQWQDKFENFTLATQNIDGLHLAAGSRDVLELHGNVWRARCLACAANVDIRELDERERPPRCGNCGGEMRPDVVLFGEMLSPEIYSRAEHAAMTSDVCFVIGTSALVYPAAGLAFVARESGAYIVEVNPEQTPLSDFCDETIEERAGVALQALEF